MVIISRRHNLHNNIATIKSKSDTTIQGTNVHAKRRKKMNSLGKDAVLIEYLETRMASLVSFVSNFRV